MKSAADAVTKAVEKAKTAIPAAAVSASVLLATAGPAKADAVQETTAFLKAFWEFRTGDPTSFVTLTIMPILVPYAVFQVLIDKKKAKQKEVLAEGGWDIFMAERGLNIDILELPQLNAYVAAAEKGLLDDEMVREFVRQLELNEKWKKSTIDVEDPRLKAVKQRARAEKIIALKEERARKEAAAATEKQEA